MIDCKSVVVLTALNLEYAAVRMHLDRLTLHVHPAGTRFERGTIRGTDCKVVLGLTGVGNQSAAVIAERAIRQFNPTAVFFVGVAGALWGTPLGDIVVASRVYAYHGGTSEDDGLKTRPRSWEANHSIDQLAKSLARSSDWTARLPSEVEHPKVHFGPIAAGEIVQNSRISREAQWIRERFNDATAIEMEAAGVSQAGHLNETTPVAIVRGISDFADGTKGSNNDGTWQPRAAANASAFAIQLAEDLITQRTETMTSTMPEPRTTTAGTVYNISSGPVGIQASSVSGSTVTMNSGPGHDTPRDPLSVLVELRTCLDRDRSNGEVDDDTYEAAKDELETAESGLKEAGDRGKKKSFLALKRLSGLVAGTTSAAAHVTLVIAALGGLT
ncbi:5'-methylthioadenosine/S-adenosylhomocysteine nucleosidase [Natronoglycomyces albus]|uniref:5'-methylthioadenosine/S-adenosylhomocysteine nucleosidase n=1 Tax=Natronoglycomyces albus TaxID=2811108 RepID=A0A895XH51_9ACTN|nr:5'-methylthioadenosine/S-adenosylhomocysteine nucleosidase [Natronoglycomyces albus]QSB04674.1 5'-methylthioadenosine/S-adenosylhomocysteine nucleosidase [Natronoglycomyces albus]